MDPLVLVAYWGFVVAVVAVPGPDWAYTLASGLRDRSVVPAVTGLALGYVLLTAAVALGVGALVAETPALLTAITVAGGAYLAYLGVRLLARPATSVAADTATGPAGETPPWPRIARGIGVSGLNPKGVLVFVALLPQFADPRHGWPFSLQITVLGVLWIVTCVAFYLTLGYATRAVLRSTPTAARVVSRVSGAAMVVVGAVLLVERF
ncbi:LysE family translocator [Mumia sp. DW29H23]|uniref:LysE family translocator n=1 Tax=Mumia sp. DW29H23 TaxID=3421241 RepID=UPI003D6876E4